MKKFNTHIFLLISFVIITTKLSAFNDHDTTKYNHDTTKIVKVPKHYFNKTIYLDYYTTGSRELDTINTVSKKLSAYQVISPTL